MGLTCYTVHSHEWEGLLPKGVMLMHLVRTIANLISRDIFWEKIGPLLSWYGFMFVFGHVKNNKVVSNG